MGDTNFGHLQMSEVKDILDLETELEHHGILGMHWGRHLPGVEVRNVSPDHVRAEELRKKHPSELSTADLKFLNDRQNTLKKNKDLNPSHLTKGKKVALGIIAGIGTGVGLYNNINSPAGKLVIDKGIRIYGKIALKTLTLIKVVK